MNAIVTIRRTGAGSRGSIWAASYNGEDIITSSRDPEHDACRALLDRGVTGRMTVYHQGSDTPASEWGIERAAKFRSADGEYGLVHRKWAPFVREAAE